MWKVNRWLAVITMVIMLVVASSGVVSARPWADCHSADPYDDCDWFEQEADEVADILHNPYYGFDFHDWSKALQIDQSLPDADLWHFAGHGQMNWYGYNWLITGDDEKLGPNDIPDLTDQHTFDYMRFAFANACHSGRDGTGPFWWVDNLHDGFIDNGCEAFFGWNGYVTFEGAYEYAILFYDLAISYGWTVSHARTVTEDLIGTPGSSSHIYGDLGVKLTP